MTTRDADRLLEELDDDQRRVATTFGPPIAVLAGAGTGKTRAITYRIAYGSMMGAYHAGAVLAVTFTTKAAGELKHRLRQLGVPNVAARTFHSAALRQARYFWPQAYGSPLAPVTDQRLPMVRDACRQLQVVVDATGMRDLLTEISWAKVSNVDAADYADLAPKAGREVAGLEPDQVGDVLARYERVKNDRGVIDFDDILLCACALLITHPGIADEVRSTYRHLVVDEYQDVSPLQHALLELWRGESRDLCVVGDPAQTIHSFAGATPGYLVDFRSRFPDAQVLSLTTDYRSTPQIVRLANTVAVHTRVESVRLRSARPAGPMPAVQAFGSEPDEAAGVARWLAQRHADGLPWRDLALLYRVHAQSPVFETALSDAGIPFTMRDADGFFDRPEIRQAMGALVQRARKAPSKPALESARDTLARLGWTEQPPPGQGQVRERWESWAALFALAQDVVAAHPDATAADLMSELEARTQLEHAPAGDAVTLSSLHAAKGLEWEGVAIVGVQEGTLPLSLAEGAEEIAEEGRLFYVGVTRARTHLLMTWAQARREGSTPRQQSRFLAGLETPATTVPTAARTTPRAPYRPSTALSEHCRVCGASLSSGAERKLGRHLTCAASYDEATLAALIAWREQAAGDQRVPGFCVLTDATLMAVAETRPGDPSALAKIPGVGRSKAEKYSPAILAILRGA